MPASVQVELQVSPALPCATVSGAGTSTQVPVRSLSRSSELEGGKLHIVAAPSGPVAQPSAKLHSPPRGTVPKNTCSHSADLYDPLAEQPSSGVSMPSKQRLAATGS